MLNKRIKDKILTAQRNEITKYLIYSKLAQSVKEPQNRSVLKRISEDELKHYDLWRKYTHQDVKPSRRRIWLYYINYFENIWNNIWNEVDGKGRGKGSGHV